MAEYCIESRSKFWDEGGCDDGDTIVGQGDVVVIEEDDDDDEALSLSDLPGELDRNQPPKEDEENCLDESESEFEFGLRFESWSGSVSTQLLPEMCAADELFFQGRILPRQCRDLMDSGSIGQDTSTSSRSSSRGSQHSSINSTTLNSSSCSSSRGAYSSVTNRFSSCPSPSPQTGFPGSSKSFPVSTGNKIRSRSQRNSSSMWESFRPGLVRTPDIELRNLSIRANNLNSCNKNVDNSNDKGAYVKKKKKEGAIGFGFLGGCKCTAGSVVTNSVPVRSDGYRISTRRKKNNVRNGEEEELRGKLKESIDSDESRARKEERKTEKLHRMPLSSRHQRTFKWVKELPHATGGGRYVRTN